VEQSWKLARDILTGEACLTTSHVKVLSVDVNLSYRLIWMLETVLLNACVR